MSQRHRAVRLARVSRDTIHADLTRAMNLVAAGTAPDTGLGECRPGFDPHEIVAAQLVQQPG